MNHATIDFETKSKCDIRKAGAWRYSEDPSTDVLCLKFKIPGRAMGLWTPVFESLTEDLMEPLLPLFEWMENGGLVEAHNAGFEEAIWQNVMNKKYHAPLVRPSQWRCSASKAAALALPRSLGEVGGALGLPVEKDMEGRRLMLKMSKPRKPTKNDDREWHDSPHDFLRLFEYCDRDVETEEAASEAMLDLSPEELRIWQLDQEINRRGIYCDIKLIEKSLEFIDIYSEALTKELQEVTNGEIQTSGQLKKILAWLENEGVFMESLAKAPLEEALGWDFLSSDARRVLEIRQALALTSPKKLKAMLTMAGADHRIRGTLMYHGASTGRWSGRGIQPQNLPVGIFKDYKDVVACLSALGNLPYTEFAKKYPDVLGAISSCIRGMLCAPVGKKLICADFSAIECRVLFWLANDIVGLEIYETHGKVYEAMAADIYNKLMEDIQKNERQLGKQAILGCGYQMGWKTFITTCAGYGITIGMEMAKRVVNAYRAKFFRVKAFWNETEAAAIEAVLKPGKVIQNGRVYWKKVGMYLFCKLPSGRKIAYYDPQIRRGETPWGEPKDLLTFMGVDSKIRKWTRQKTYGGKLVENITQAVARDFMAEAMLRVEDVGYEIILTVHDELLAETNENFGSLEEFENLMAQRPAWGMDCPIEVEGWEGKRFRK